MPPHCDTRDGPVVRAAMAALEAGNVDLVLPFVPEDAEAQLRTTFDAALRARQHGPEAQHAADEWLFETAVRLHRAGEGAPFFGLRPAGLDPGPVIPLAEQALHDGDAGKLVAFMQKAVREALMMRFDHARSLQGHDVDDVPAARAYTSAMLEFLVFSHHLYKQMQAAEVHEGSHETHAVH